jgi:hypothetical protein
VVTRSRGGWTRFEPSATARQPQSWLRTDTVCLLRRFLREVASVSCNQPDANVGLLLLRRAADGSGPAAQLDK